MIRLLCLIVLSLGLVQSASAEDGDKISTYLTEKFGLAREKAEQISLAVKTAASKYSLPPALLLAIISIESRFKEKARGAHGATGLMQVVPAAHRSLLKDVKDLTAPDANIDAGSAILHGYLQAAGGDVGLALKSYGGSKAYAQKVSLRADSFQQVVGRQDAHSQLVSTSVCDPAAAGHCPGYGTVAGMFFNSPASGASASGEASEANVASASLSP
jgi:hypothetical protein